MEVGINHKFYSFSSFLAQLTITTTAYSATYHITTVDKSSKLFETIHHDGRVSLLHQPPVPLVAKDLPVCTDHHHLSSMSIMIYAFYSVHLLSQYYTTSKYQS